LDNPENRKLSDFQATEFKLFLGLQEMAQRAFMAGFFEGFNPGVRRGPEMKKDLQEGTKEILDRFERKRKE
jgi:hypothetical protein